MPTRINVRQDYAAFLRIKNTPGVTYDGDFAIVPDWQPATDVAAKQIDELAPHLHDYQRFSVVFAVARRRAALFLECGLGKTSISLAWAEHMRDGGPAMVCAPLVAIHEFENEVAKFFPMMTVQHVRTGDVSAWLDDPNGIALVSHHAFVRQRDLTGLSAFVLDECFAPGTPVDCMVDGHVRRVHIEDVRPGDQVLNVTGVDTVRATHSREVNRVIRIKVDGQRIFSSANHPYFTKRGWVRARNLQSGDCVMATAEGMRLVQEGFRPEGLAPIRRPYTILREVLLREMEDASAGKSGSGAFTGSGCEAWAEKARMVAFWESEGRDGVGADSKAQPDEGSGRKKEDLANATRKGAQTTSAGRERTRDDRTATHPIGSARERVGVGTPGFSRSEACRVSDPLQTGPSTRRENGRYRSRRALAQEQENAGREEGSGADWARVDGVEILELGHPDLERFRTPDGKLHFHDIEATRHPSFSVNGLLVHNSSILKSGDGAIARHLASAVQTVDNRLALSATPAPNDPTEYATHATWLGYVRSDAEFRSRFFVRDGKDWRVKKHAVHELPQWLSRFALWMRDPSVYGMPCDALPPNDYRVSIEDIEQQSSVDVDRDLFGAPLAGMTMSNRAAVRRDVYSSTERMSRVVDVARKGHCIVWANYNAHADACERAIRDAGISVAQIAGRTPDVERVAIVAAFQAGGIDCIVAKPKVIGHGVNLQRAERMVFAAYDESYEAYHQAVRRAHRQGRVGCLDVHMMVSPDEQRIIDVLAAKGDEWDRVASEHERIFAGALQTELECYQKGETMPDIVTTTSERLADVENPDHYRIMHGDSIAIMRDTMEPDSVDLAVFSPPFSSLFTYSSEPEDMGNCTEGSDAEFSIHFAHFCDALLRVMRPGRVVCLHLAQLVAFRNKHGRKGLRDFRGLVVNRMSDAGFHYYGEFVVPKNPQAAAIRTKSERLQFSQFKRDSLESSPALNDYVLEFRKPGKQAVRVHNDVSNEEWIEWASGVWGDIRETDVIQGWQGGRAEADEKHICPLQLEVIRRCVRLWTNPGETVFTPFAGIGSEIYVAIEQGRFGLGVELKAEYFRQAAINADMSIERNHKQQALL
jgi:DNA modification methylase